LGTSGAGTVNATGWGTDGYGGDRLDRIGRVHPEARAAAAGKRRDAQRLPLHLLVGANIPGARERGPADAAAQHGK